MKIICEKVAFKKVLLIWQITGDTIYNMLRLSEVEIGMDERPVNPYKITSTEVGMRLSVI